MTWKASDPMPIYADIDHMIGLFDFTTGGLGDKATALVSQSILDSMDAEVDCDGIPWAALSYGYEQWKTSVAPGQPIGVLWGSMKTLDQLEGEQIIQPKHIVHTYGKDAMVRTEAMKFQLGGLVTGTRQPQRHFFGFNWAATWKLGHLFDAIFKTI